ncbi:unnamed protein product [Hymenolepis diminuta]|uniref:Uncharacterized protein n=1 Tax=Hymenolepis diminuta TaxID=6216 RepID=A0A564YJ88_HYMDI|nr:unnamed protein product [Hymenolepis diminuta]
MNSDEIHQNENATDEDQSHENITLQNSNQGQSLEENQQDGGQPMDFQSSDSTIKLSLEVNVPSDNLTSEQRVCEKIRASDVEKLNELRKNMNDTMKHIEENEGILINTFHVYNDVIRSAIGKDCQCIAKTPPMKDNGTDADDTMKITNEDEDIILVESLINGLPKFTSGISKDDAKETECPFGNECRSTY